MFGRKLTLFRLLGFEVGLDLSWLLLALLVTWTLAIGYFPAELPGLAPGTYWWMAVLGALGLFFSIVFHEFSHSLVARRHGLGISGITLFVFGGVAQMEGEPDRPKTEFLMAVAGPVASIVLAGLFWLFAALGQQAGGPATVITVLAYLAWINLLLALFNLVPAFPLDGGRMLRAALWGWRGNLRWATAVASRSGNVFALVLMAFGGVQLVTGNVIGGMWMFLIGLFLHNAAAASYQQTLLREALAGMPVARMMIPHPVTVPPDLTLAELVEDYFYRHYFKMFPVVDASGRLLGAVSLRDAKEVPRERWADTRVADILQRCTRANTIDPRAPALEAMTRMNESGLSRLLVAEGDRLAGIIALKDLLRFLGMRLELEGAGGGAPAPRAPQGPGVEARHGPHRG